MMPAAADDPEPKAKAEDMWPIKSLADTADKIEDRKARAAEVTKRIDADQAELHALMTEIELLNKLRQLAGAQPL